MNSDAFVLATLAGFVLWNRADFTAISFALLLVAMATGLYIGVRAGIWSVRRDENGPPPRQPPDDDWEGWT